MIAEILTNTGKVENHLDSRLTQMMGWADATSHQKMGRAYRSGSQNHFALSLNNRATRRIN
jgi:hypothetical protein